jgi:hypothetical protein
LSKKGVEVSRFDMPVLPPTKERSPSVHALSYQEMRNYREFPDTIVIPPQGLPSTSIIRRVSWRLYVHSPAPLGRRVWPGATAARLHVAHECP